MWDQDVQDREELEQILQILGMVFIRLGISIRFTQPFCIALGPGAENGTRVGTIFSEVASNGSAGFGSVMGSKNLKAIVVRGSGTIPVADRQRIESMMKDEYYQLRGWDVQTGLLKKDTLKKLSLDDIIEPLWG